MRETSEQQAQVEWTHEYRCKKDNMVAAYGWRYRPGETTDFVAESLMSATDKWEPCFLQWATPDALKWKASRVPEMYPNFRVIREPAPTAEAQAPAWTAGAVKAWESADGPWPTRWRKLPDGYIESQQRNSDGTWPKWLADGGREYELDRSCTAVPVLPAPEPPPQPEGTIEWKKVPGGYVWLDKGAPAPATPQPEGTIEWKKVPGGYVWLDKGAPAPATPQPDPDRLILEQIVYLLADLRSALNGNGHNDLLADVLNGRVPAIVEMLEGRRP